ncbi:MAG: ribosome silencing factor [Sporomusaceae bacterium]|jgi:ribosome-associated protein|nr:ribosome silencing factor [Sporomusaceae bacterium]
MNLALAKDIANAADDKKARDIVILDIASISPVTDYFIICSASSDTQTKAIADNIEEKLAEKDILPLHKEGYREGHWVLLDYGDAIVHIFLEEERQFYNLEKLWSDAKPVEFECAPQ